MIEIVYLFDYINFNILYELIRHDANAIFNLELMIFSVIIRSRVFLHYIHLKFLYLKKNS